MTQKQYAEKNIITNEMREAARFDNVSPEFIREGLVQGNIVIPKNVNHSFSARAIGKGLKTKINANIGTSEISCKLPEELKKLELALKFGCDSVMDLSTGGNLIHIRSLLLNNSPVMLGTVPIYAVICELLREEKPVTAMTSDILFNEIEQQAAAGVDFITVHCGITKETISHLKKSERVLGVVSRGGSLLKKWIEETGNENPLYAEFDRLLTIAEKYDVTLSLGDGLRPGSQNDASDRGQISELLILGELVERAQKRGVQVMVEGPGHIPLDEIEMNVRLEKKLCNDAPFYVLGPLVTDIAPGYDHITGAIGGALAASYGADFLCYVTPAEHLCLPDTEDVKKGVIASKIAAHCGDLIKRRDEALKIDRAISEARQALDWKGIFQHAIDPELAQQRKENTSADNSDYCSMCGSLCAVKIDKDRTKTQRDDHGEDQKNR